MLCLARHICTVTQALRSGALRFNSTGDYLAAYERYCGVELGSATVGVIGLGAVGRAVARRLGGFGSRVLGYDPYVARAEGVHLVELPALLRESDFVTVHCVANDETRGMLGAAQLAQMKPGARLLNLARASIVDEDALYAALAGGRLGGAALDVFRDEPVQPENRFVQLPNVLAMPHLGGATVDVVRHQTDMIVESIEQYLRGERPRSIWNPEALAAGSAFPPRA
jgi:phosphoglycerate dehydrogenase-like enzyme